MLGKERKSVNISGISGSTYTNHSQKMKKYTYTKLSLFWNISVEKENKFSMCSLRLRRTFLSVFSNHVLLQMSLSFHKKRHLSLWPVLKKVWSRSISNFSCDRHSKTKRAKKCPLNLWQKWQNMPNAAIIVLLLGANTE